MKKLSNDLRKKQCKEAIKMKQKQENMNKQVIIQKSL